MKAVEELAPAVGTSVACAAVGVPRSTVYRHRQPKAAAARSHALRRFAP